MKKNRKYSRAGQTGRVWWSTDANSNRSSTFCCLVCASQQTSAPEPPLCRSVGQWVCHAQATEATMSIFTCKKNLLVQPNGTACFNPGWSFQINTQINCGFFFCIKIMSTLGQLWHKVRNQTQGPMNSKDWKHIYNICYVSTVFKEIQLQITITSSEEISNGSNPGWWLVYIIWNWGTGHVIFWHLALKWRPKEWRNAWLSHGFSKVTHYAEGIFSSKL